MDTATIVPAVEATSRDVPILTDVVQTRSLIPSACASSSSRTTTRFC